MLPFDSRDARARGGADRSRTRTGCRSPTVIAKVPQHRAFSYSCSVLTDHRHTVNFHVQTDKLISENCSEQAGGQRELH